MSGKQLFRLETGKVDIKTEVKHEKKRNNERGFWILLKKKNLKKRLPNKFFCGSLRKKTSARSLKREKIIATNGDPA